jgi:glycosyltransferase 2 family protein
MKKKSTRGLVLRIVTSFVLLGLLTTRIPSFEVDKLVPVWSSSVGFWLCGALFLTLLGVLLSALRWQKVLDVLGVHVGLRPLLSVYFAGQFVSNVLPTTIGGDVLRVSRLSRRTGASRDTFASVVLERLTGWLVLPLLTFTGFLVNPYLAQLGVATIVALGLAFTTITGLMLLLFVAAHQRLGGRFAAREGWRSFLGAVHLGLRRFGSDRGAALKVLAVGFAYQLVLVLAAVAAAQSLGIRPAGLTVLLAFFPAVAIAQVLPIGISGIGVREGAFVLFLGPLGVATEQAIALGLLLYFLNLGVSLLGAPAFAIGGGAGHDLQQAQPDTDVQPTVSLTA